MTVKDFTETEMSTIEQLEDQDRGLDWNDVKVLFQLLFKDIRRIDKRLDSEGLDLDCNDIKENLNSVMRTIKEIDPEGKYSALAEIKRNLNLKRKTRFDLLNKLRKACIDSGYGVHKLDASCMDNNYKVGFFRIHNAKVIVEFDEALEDAKSYLEIAQSEEVKEEKPSDAELDVDSKCPMDKENEEGPVA